jgi:hypothetical protein
MRPACAALLLVLIPLRAGVGSAGATRAPASGADLSPLARKYALKREALLKDFVSRRRALVSSPRWRALSAEKQNVELAGLLAELRTRDKKLTAEYDAEVSGLRGKRSADEAADQLARQRRLDEIRTQAAQDAVRAKQAP